jgi:hypothetical protein
MKNTRFGIRFLICTLALFCFVSSGLFAQEVKNLNGAAYTVIIPEDFARFADYGDFKVGEKFVIEGQISRISGAYLTIRNAGAANRFVLAVPTRLDFGTDVTIYTEISKINSDGVESKIVKLESPNGTGQIPASNETRTLDGVQYKILQPEEYAFYIDMGKLKTGEKYVIDDSVMSVSGTTLLLRNTGMNRFSLGASQRLAPNAAVRVYIEIVKATPPPEAKITKVETR